ncbi:glycosyltransferase involved in cell wall biosynthesis [Rhodoblastus acidophilus]|uniref:glycosyltransferase family 4 protein n=1 Tax=Rhodoblastus acidophilus TaxID=1074 RepID=UPI002224D296|nr:glycosyltransferase family 4 protein [Rhodoblastus acidophilus]MCW2317790.1 glycosyltransferase involved in cell wall biosynthesis [Rhodoblastus acidophilus]
MARKPNALVLCFFPAFSPPSSGGEMRLGGLYREVARHYDVTLLTSTDFGARFEEIQHRPGFRELRFPKDDFWRKAYATLDASGLSGDLSPLAFALAVSDPACELRRVARELAGDADVIIHDFPYSEPIFSEGAPAPEIYNSHNVEASLLSSIARGPGFEAAWLKLLRIEGNLIRRAQKVFATSAADAEIFRLLYGAAPDSLFLCPNGYAEEEIADIAALRAGEPRDSGARPTLLFTGSGHHPNVEAAESLLSLARYMPDCRFVIAGGVCGALEHWARGENVELFGPFTPKQKKELLAEADLYVNPVTLGSGTSLKAVEALAAHLPMVSTPEGVRGLDLTPDEHALIAPREDFVLAIRRALADADLRARLAASGRDLARTRFCWSAIADRFAADLAAERAADLADPEPSRPLALAFNDYSLSGLQSGGAARVANLLGALDCDIVLLTFAASAQVVLLEGGVLQIGAPKSADHLAFEAGVNRGQTISVNDGVAALFVAGARALREIAAGLAPRAQALIFEHPYMAPALDELRRLRPDLPVVYSAHNVEAALKRTLLRGHPLARSLVGFIAELERRLVTQADLIVCCTEADRRRFAAMIDKSVVLAANGCRIAPLERPPAMARAQKRVGFLGSSHGPNVAAADHIVSKLAPLFPQIRFELIGTVCTALTVRPPDNVVLHGVAPERMKTFLMQQWDLALNPLTSGGGSSLKLPDYMAHGLPTLNTPEGARGFAVAERGAGLVVPLAEFPAALSRMLADPEALAEQGRRARAYAEDELSWAAVAQDYRDALQPLARPPAPSPQRRLLVVTYRYTEPSRGGAEEYLIETLKRLRGRFSRIDLAAVDVERIENRHHFGCELTDGPGAAGRLGELFDSARYFPCEELSEPEMRERASDLERVWASEEFHLLAPFAKTFADPASPRLFSGFFGPEAHDGAIRRWTAPDFSFLLPQDARLFQLRGFASVAKTFSMVLLQAPRDGSAIVSVNCETRLSPHFDVHFALPQAPDDCVRILLCRAEEHQAPGDYRPFGVLVEAACVLCGDQDVFAPMTTRWVDLTLEPSEMLRSRQFDAWVEALRGVALRREPEIDAAFASVRGPHAPAMQDWLAAHGGDYDAVLVQGVPFDVVPSSVATLAAAPERPRIVTLPHFHGDDRFYHWKIYYDAFAAADRTLLFSSSLARRLGEADKFAVVPGGGVRVEDLGGPGVEAAFRAVCPVENPFFLVLGRKTGSKGYHDVIEAHRRLRAVRADLDLVMVGPDDDGAPAEAPGLHVLGRQSREVARGALAGCLGLISMSRSESFGIVLCEAWLFGKPVIANANCYSFRDLVRDGETGLLVSGVDALAQAMARLADDPQARRRMGRAGFVDVMAHYSWETCADAIDAQL